MNLLVAIVAMASSVSASAGVIEFFGNGACQILGQGNQYQIKDNSETGCIRLVGSTQSAEYMMGGNCLVGLYSSDNCDPNTVIGSINPGPDGATGEFQSLVL